MAWSNNHLYPWPNKPRVSRRRTSSETKRTCKYLRRPLPRLEWSNLSLRWLTSQKTKRTTFSSRCHLSLRTMLSTWELFTSVPQYLNLPTLSLTLVQSTWLSLVPFVMMRHLVNTDLRNLTHNHRHSLRETKNLSDARPWRMICRSLTPKRSYLRLLRSWHTDLQSFRALSGRTTHAFSLLTLRRKVVLTLSYNFLKTSALFSNSLLFTSLKVLGRSLTVSWVSLLTKTRARLNYTTSGLSRTMESLTTPW